MNIRIMKPTVVLGLGLTILMNAIGLGNPTTTYAEEPTTFTVTDFSYHDKDVDKIGEEKVGADGEADFHFTVSLDIPENIEIGRMDLIPADSQGNETGSSVWWSSWNSRFLGVYRQGKPVISEQTDSVGRFAGKVTLDLYASNDHKTFINGQYFVLRIDTPIESYTTPPVKYIKTISTPVAQGGEGKVIVKNAEPLAEVTLMQKVGLATKEIETKSADKKGLVVFSNVPEGDNYFVVQDVEGAKSQSNFVSVTASEEEPSGLIDEDSVKVTSKYSAGKFAVSITGKVLDKKIKKVTVEAGKTKASVTVKNGSFSYKKKLSAASLVDVINITAKNADGEEETVTTELETDLASDETVYAEEDSGTWNISGLWTKKAATAVVAVVKNKVVPVKNLELDDTGFTGEISTDADLEDIKLIIVDKAGKYEVIEPKTGL